MPTSVHDAEPQHLEAIAAIYAAAVETPATFDVEAPSLAAWREVHAALDPAAGDFLLVALAGREVAGYARSGAFKERPAYNSTRETAAYVAAEQRGRGMGHALYAELLRRLEASEHLLLAVAGVTVPNPASERLHAAHGFTEVGTFTSVGVKLGRPRDVRWYQRPLA